MRSAMILGAALMTVTGCSQVGPNDAICEPLPSMLMSEDDSSRHTNPIYQRALATQCIHRLAYRLAMSGDPAPVVADAVMGGCESAVFQAAYTAEADDQGRGAEAPMGFDSLTGEAINRYEQSAREFRRMALFRVVEARAGNCAIPE